MSNYPQKVLTGILDTIFPKKCLGCGKFTGKRDFNYVCGKCFSGLSFKNTFECIGCKRRTTLGLTCISCRKENYVDQLVIAAELTDLTDQMIKALKYRFIVDMREPLSIIAKKSVKNLLTKGFNLFGDNPFIIPVPLHRTRLNERGFNQSWLIAKDIADTFNISSGENVLYKKHNFKHQANIKTKEERMKNIKDNFVVAAGELIKDRTIILVDDICTTGATLNECARVLKESGAKRVIGFVIARGQFKK